MNLLRYVPLAIVMFGVGCGPDLSHLPKTVRAEGVVTLDGTPVADATVNFIAVQGTYNASTVTDKNGHFTLNAFKEKPGAVPGQYAVEINKTIASAGEGGEVGLVSVKYGLPKKYASMGTSGLKSEIPDRDILDLKFDLKSN